LDITLLDADFCQVRKILLPVIVGKSRCATLQGGLLLGAAVDFALRQRFLQFINLMDGGVFRLN